MFLITCRFYPSGEAFGTASDDATVSIPNSTPSPPPKKKQHKVKYHGTNMELLVRAVADVLTTCAQWKSKWPVGVDLLFY